MREIRAARDRGLPIFGETCIQYLYLTVDDLDRPGFEGAKYVCSPPLREERNQAVLYQALRQGALQGISTDHCPFNFKEQKELGLGDFTKIPNGLPAIEHRLTLLYDRSVRQGHMSIVDLVRHGSWGPARIFGLDSQGRARARLRRRRRRLRPRGQAHDLGRDARDERRLRPVRGLGGPRASRASCSRAGRRSTRTARSSPRPGRGRFVKRSIFEPAVA